MSAVAVLALALLAPLQLKGQDPLQPAQEPEDTVLVPVGPVQPDIYVADLSGLDGLHYVGPLQNITNRTYSYDDQPVFTPDSRSLLYTTEYGYGDRVQTEINRYYLSSRRETRITRTEQSEYSPTPVPGDRAFFDHTRRGRLHPARLAFYDAGDGRRSVVPRSERRRIPRLGQRNDPTPLRVGKPSHRPDRRSHHRRERSGGRRSRTLPAQDSQSERLESCREGFGRRGVDQRSQHRDPRSQANYLDRRRGRVPRLDSGRRSTHGHAKAGSISGIPRWTGVGALSRIWRRWGSPSAASP